jgi:hypothetical protein
MAPEPDFPGLKPEQFYALVLLMVQARELTNNELKELAGFTLTGKENKQLEDLGLITTNRSHRPYSHQLTDKGWRIVREIHGSTPPKSRGPAIKTLFALLANLHRSLDRLHISHGEFFKQGGSGAPRPAAADLRTPDVETAIRTAYRELATRPGDWIGLADLRERLGPVDRAAVDDTLRVMVRQEGVRIIPIANTRALKPRDRAAALRIGDEDNHALAIGET